MSKHTGAHALTGLVADFQNRSDWIEKLTYLFCAFWLLVASLELVQDYLNSVLNNTPFYLYESLSFKLFWLMFLPAIPLIGYLNNRAFPSLDKPLQITIAVVETLMFSLAHLVVFSLILFGISHLIHAEAWSMRYLLTEKFSTRLYIALLAYASYATLYFWVSHRKKSKPAGEHHAVSSISVKQGRKTVLVDVESVRWIESDGQYLVIHAAGKKHVISGSLKHIITRLPGNFMRIHRSTILNIDRIKELRSRMNGDYDVILKSGEELRLSRNYAGPLKEILL